MYVHIPTNQEFEGIYPFTFIVNYPYEHIKIKKSERSWLIWLG